MKYKDLENEWSKYLFQFILDHPDKEWEETELKLQPIISALSGGQIWVILDCGVGNPEFGMIEISKEVETPR